MSQPPSLSSPPSDLLPSTRLLHRGAGATLVLLAVLAGGVALPAETGRDPIGLGALLGLREMGRIKVALAQEAAADDSTAMAGATAGAPSATDAAAAATGASVDGTNRVTTSGVWRDSITVTLQPNKGVELKLSMQRGDTADYEWTSDAGEIYFHRHGEPPGAPKDAPAHTYDKGMTASDRGLLIAEFTGVHGWFWRNRSADSVRVTLRTRGSYATLRAM